MEIGYSTLVNKYFDVGRDHIIDIRVSGITREPAVRWDGPGRYAVSAAAAHIDW